MAKLLYLSGYLIAITALFFMFTGHSDALPTGITLSPFQQEIGLQPGDTDRSFELTLTNNTPSVQELRLNGQDFGSLNETGGVLLEGSKTYTQKYGLVSWLKLGTDSVVLEPKESRTITVTVQNRASMQPGGHYGAVVASVISIDAAKKNKIVINQQLLSLLLVKKIGGEAYDLQLVDIKNNGNLLHLPSTVQLRFHNPGNVHVVPRGIVRLKSPSGKVLSQGIINSESAFVLPETYREVYVPLSKVSSQYLLPGVYRIEVEYRYEGILKTVKKSSQVHFVSLPTYFLVVLCIAGIAYVLKAQKTRRKIAK